jgi:hypothetical protein
MVYDGHVHGTNYDKPVDFGVSYVQTKPNRNVMCLIKNDVRDINTMSEVSMAVSPGGRYLLRIVPRWNLGKEHCFPRVLAHSILSVCWTQTYYLRLQDPYRYVLSYLPSQVWLQVTGLAALAMLRT